MVGLYCGDARRKNLPQTMDIPGHLRCSVLRIEVAEGVGVSTVEQDDAKTHSLARRLAGVLHGCYDIVGMQKSDIVEAATHPQPRRHERTRVGIMLETQLDWHHHILRGIAHYMLTNSGWVPYITSAGDINANLDGLSKLKLHGIIAGNALDNSKAGWRKFLTTLERLGVPTVLTLREPQNSGLCEVVPDDWAVGSLVAQHLQQHGFRNYGYYGGDMPFAWVRKQGFTQKLAAWGLECSVYMVKNIPWGSLHVEWEKTALAKWLLNLRRPAAVMACSDLWARHIAYACARVGLRIPEDIALVGVDNDLALCEMITPSMTSVPLDPRRIGLVAATLLSQAIRGKAPARQLVLVPPLALIARHSSDILVVDDPDIAQAARFIRENAAALITVEDVLTAVHISRRKLELGFQRNFKRSPKEEIWRVHVERAKILLEQTDLKMPGVACQSGLSDAHQLSVVFRRATGHTPSAWRARCRRS